MLKIIFVSGLDNLYNSSYISVAAQAGFLQKGAVGANIIPYRFNEPVSTITSAINSNRDAYVVLFSKSCEYSLSIAKFMKELNLPLNRLYINECYSTSSLTLKTVTDAIAQGVPTSNVFSGDKPGVGSRVPNHSKLQGRVEHNQSLEPLGKVILSRFSGGSPSIGGPSVPGSGYIPPITTITPTTDPNQTRPSQIQDTPIDVAPVISATPVSPVTPVTQTTGDILSPSSSPQPVITQASSRGNIFAENTKPQSTSDVGQIQKLTKFFEPTIKPTQINVDFSPIKDRLSNKDIEHITSDFGYKPLVYYYGLPLAYSDIRKILLYHIGILPAVEIIYQDSWGLFKEDAFPPDNAIITVFINSKSDNLRSILMDFKILSFRDNNQGTYTIVGTCNVPELYLKRFRSYKNKTSHETLQLVAKECELGFSSNIKNSNDTMTYINPGYMVQDFIQSTIDNSYVSDLAFQQVYIDFHYQLCYVDLNSEMERDISKDLAIDTEIVTNRKLDEKKEVTDESKLSPMFLSTEKSLRDSNSFVEKFEILNKSTEVSIRKGYRIKTKFYDTVNKLFSIFNVESQTSDGTKTMILKSNPSDEKFFQDNTQSVYLGKQDINTNGVGNVHSNYQYSVIQNRQNLDDLAKISAKLYLPNENFNLHIYQKIKVIFIPQNPLSAEQVFFKRITGDWLITDIEFNHETSQNYQIVTVIKRELGLLPDEMGKFPKKSTATQQNYQRNQNELAPGDVPFSQNVGSGLNTVVQPQSTLDGLLTPLPEQQFSFGSGPLDYNTDEIIEAAKKRGIKTAFEDSLRKVIEWSKNNASIQSISDLAYLLATAAVESNYSLQRWEADFACKSTGIPYADKPCQAALDYYRSTKGKKNYYELGVDSRGLPFFGRGLIQLTGKANMERYGKIIGVDLVSNPELAFVPEISYKLAIAFLTLKRSGTVKRGTVSYSKNGKARSTLEMASDGDLTAARISVNGGTNGLDECNSKYRLWLDILTPFVKLNTGAPAITGTPVNPQPGQNQTLPNQPLPQPSQGTINIVIGDSQSPAIVSKSQKYQLYGKQEGETSLWKVGSGLPWLLKSVQNIPPTPSIKNVAISIGTNGGFNSNENVSGLVAECRRAFPNAKLFAVKGSWGWGGNKNITEQKVNDYYNKFAVEGVEIVPTPIGNMVNQLPKENHPDQNKTASFAQIGKDLDGSAVA